MASLGSGPPFPIDDPDTLIDDPGAGLDDGPTMLAAPCEEDLPAPDSALVAALVEEGRALVEPLARIVARQVGYRELAELCSVGRAALVEAAREYDASRARFTGWAAQRLRWAMIDHVRRETRGRGAGRRALALAASELVGQASPEAPASDRMPSEETARAALAGALAGHAAALAVGLLAARGGPTDRIPDPGPDPEAAVEERRTVERLRAAVADLPDRQRELVQRHYFEDERFDHIAQSLGLSKSWASRLHAQAIADLGRALGRRR